MSPELWALACWGCACVGFVAGAWWSAHPRDADADEEQCVSVSCCRARPSGGWHGAGSHRPAETTAAAGPAPSAGARGTLKPETWI